ncbi:MAG: pentapeptide repeat-containing protein, partial [Cyanobacteriota bacterium]
MKDLIQKLLSFSSNRISSSGGRIRQDMLLFDSLYAAQEIAFILDGEWDGCNGVILLKKDELAVNTAAKLVGAQWCYCEDKSA